MKKDYYKPILDGFLHFILLKLLIEYSASNLFVEKLFPNIIIVVLFCTLSGVSCISLVLYKNQTMKKGFLISFITSLVLISLYFFLLISGIGISIIPQRELGVADGLIIIPFFLSYIIITLLLRLILFICFSVNDAKQ